MSERDRKTGPDKGQQTMLKVGGEHFRCDCGCNVFTKVSNVRYLCNACEASYIVDPEA